MSPRVRSPIASTPDRPGIQFRSGSARSGAAVPAQRAGRLPRCIRRFIAVANWLRSVRVTRAQAGYRKRGEHLFLAQSGFARVVFSGLREPCGDSCLRSRPPSLGDAVAGCTVTGWRGGVMIAAGPPPGVMPRRGRVGGVARSGGDGREVVRWDDGTGDLSRSSSWLRGSRQRRGRLPDSARSTAAGRIASMNG